MNGEDVYKKFKEIESQVKNIPLNFNYSKLSSKNKDMLEHMADLFNTVYQNINIDAYIRTGFKLWKRFDISKLNDSRVFEKYKSDDKRYKRNFNPDKKTIMKSMIYIKKNYTDLYNYCKSGGMVRQPIHDYLQNLIDPVVLCYLIEKKYLKLNNEEINFLSYFNNNYVDIKSNMYKHHNMLQKYL